MSSAASDIVSSLTLFSTTKVDMSPDDGSSRLRSGRCWVMIVEEARQKLIITFQPVFAQNRSRPWLEGVGKVVSIVGRARDFFSFWSPSDRGRNVHSVAVVKVFVPPGPRCTQNRTFVHLY